MMRTADAMSSSPLQAALCRLFLRRCGARHHLLSRWFFLRALGLIYFSAFFSLIFQIRGLMGPSGILPAGEYLSAVRQSLRGLAHLWYAPTLLWLGTGNGMLDALCWVGLAASLLVVANIATRISLAVCFVCFLSFVSTAQVFSGYQSDGMLLAAGFLALFVVPGGLLPGLGRRSLATHASLLLLLWEWFRIYFESGVVKLQSGDPTWRNLTAMYEYYQNGPLPTWVGWYLQHLPHWFQIGSAALTLVMELGLVFLAFLPRPWRTVCFFIVTIWQAGVILTANYCFLNYLVLALGFLLLDDRTLLRGTPRRWRSWLAATLAPAPEDAAAHHSRLRTGFATAGSAVGAAMLVWIFYATSFPLVRMFAPRAPLPTAPVLALEPLRIANQYGLFATMTPHRYEIEFQGSTDGGNWQAYPFRYKPQNPAVAPGIYAPYQPRFEWNLWFASLGAWRDNPMVPRTEERLLENNRDVLALFAGNPFIGTPPRYVRAVLWQYWFTSWAQKKATGMWWRRQLLGTYAPTLTRVPDGRFAIVAEPTLPMGAPE